MLPLHGRTAVISGGSGGIGLAIARRFARYGANVVITGRSADKIQAALKQLRRDQHARPRAYQVHKGYSFDAGNSTGWEALVKQHVGPFQPPTSSRLLSLSLGKYPNEITKIGSEHRTHVSANKLPVWPNNRSHQSTSWSTVPAKPNARSSSERRIQRSPRSLRAIFAAPSWDAESSAGRCYGLRRALILTKRLSPSVSSTCPACWRTGRSKGPRSMQLPKQECLV